jgi:SAM-dependent methyltransferase
VVQAQNPDKAGVGYWNATWDRAQLPPPFDPADTSLDNYVNVQLHRYFRSRVADQSGLKVLEIGCANSIWSVHFHQFWQASVTGLDYSEVGCAKTRQLFDAYGIAGDVLCADLFAPPSDLLAQFDIVMSFGVVEHFRDTASCLRACARFVKPSGRMITLIPNLTGLVGWIQKSVDPAVYGVHVPLTREQFAAAHRQAGIDLLECDYFLAINLSAVNSGRFSVHPWNRHFRHLLSATSKVVWLLEGRGARLLPTNRFTSPYIIAVARIGSDGTKRA